MEGIGLNLEEGFPKVFTCPRRFPEPEHLILNANSLQVLEAVESEASHVAEAIKVGGLELVKDPHNLFLGQSGEAEGNVLDF